MSISFAVPEFDKSRQCAHGIAGMGEITEPIEMEVQVDFSTERHKLEFRWKTEHDGGIADWTSLLLMYYISVVCWRCCLLHIINWLCGSNQPHCKLPGNLMWPWKRPTFSRRQLACLFKGLSIWDLTHLELVIALRLHQEGCWISLFVGLIKCICIISMASLPQVCDPSKLRAFGAISRSAISPFPNQRFNLLGLFEDHSIDEYAVFAQIISRQALQKGVTKLFVTISGRPPISY